MLTSNLVRNRWLVFTAVVVGGLMLAACAAPAEPETVTVVETVEVEAAPVDKTVVEFWTTDNEEDRVNVYEAIAAAYMAEHPEIEIRIVAIEEAGVTQRMATALAANRPPDIVRMGVEASTRAWPGVSVGASVSSRDQRYRQPTSTETPTTKSRTTSRMRRTRRRTLRYRLRGPCISNPKRGQAPKVPVPVGDSHRSGKRSALPSAQSRIAGPDPLEGTGTFGACPRWRIRVP